MGRNLTLLTSYWFVGGLIILLANDFILKETYGNWITGKLSDFAGLFIFPLFWSALFPKHKVKIFWLTGILFVFWKSSYSESFINLWNGLGLLKISRVVDYSDLVSLTVLPISFLIESKNPRTFKLNINPIFPLLVSAFAFMATSVSEDSAYIYYGESYRTNKNREAVVEFIQKTWNTKCHTSTRPNHPDYDYCDIYSSNDSIVYYYVEIHENKNGMANIKLHSIYYADYLVDQNDEVGISSRAKKRLRQLFNQEIIAKLENIP